MVLWKWPALGERCQITHHQCGDQARARLRTDPSTAHFQDVEPGGSSNFLFMLTPEHRAGGQASHKGLTGALGKLEVRWRSSSAALGRLQTQQIMANNATQKDVSLTLCSLPQACSSHRGSIWPGYHTLRSRRLQNFASGQKVQHNMLQTGYCPPVHFPVCPPRQAACPGGLP